MADSYHIIDGKVVPYSGGRVCNNTDAWRDATPLELQLQEQLDEYEHKISTQTAEIEALRAEMERVRAVLREQRKRDEVLLQQALDVLERGMRNTMFGRCVADVIRKRLNDKLSTYREVALAVLAKENNNG